MAGIALNVLITIIIAYGAGKLIKSFFPEETISFIAIGFLCYMGVLQVCNYVLIPIGVSSKIFLLLYLGLGVLVYGAGVVRKVDFRPSKCDVIGLGVGLVFAAVGTWKAMNTGLGNSHLDTTFYLSLVNEKSVASVIGGPESIFFYSGKAQPLDFTYDYQAFYILEAMIIKLLRSVGMVETLSVYNYMWGSSIVYYMMHGILIADIWQLIFRKKKVLGVLWLSLCLYIFCFKYYSLALSFFGNSWRILVISYITYFIHQYVKSEDVRYSILIGLLGNGLIAFSSSGGFLMAFVSAGLVIYNIFFVQDMKKYLQSMIPLVLTFPYLTIVLIDKVGVLAYGAVVAFGLYFGLVYLLYRKNVSEKWFFLVHKVGVVLVVVLLVVLSYFIQKGSEYPYAYFFGDHSAYDMVHDYLGKWDVGLHRVNIIFWTIVVIWVILDRDVFRRYMLVMVAVFINPLVTPFIIKFLTNFVFYRDFELVFNMYTFALFVSALSLIKWDKVVTVCSIGAIGLVGYYTVQEYLSYYHPELIPEEDFNPLYRITNDEITVYEALQEECTYDRLTVISQAEGTKGYVVHIQMPYSVYETRKVDPYLSRLETEEQFNEKMETDAGHLINPLFHREYTGQQAFVEDPDYEHLNDLIMERGAQYVIMRQDMFKLKDDVYVPVWNDIRGIADVIFENDTYVLMKVR